MIERGFPKIICPKIAKTIGFHLCEEFMKYHSETNLERIQMKDYIKQSEIEELFYDEYGCDLNQFLTPDPEWKTQFSSIIEINLNEKFEIDSEFILTSVTSGNSKLGSVNWKISYNGSNIYMMMDNFANSKCLSFSKELDIPSLIKSDFLYLGIPNSENYSKFEEFRSNISLYGDLVRTLYNEKTSVVIPITQIIDNLFLLQVFNELKLAKIHFLSNYFKSSISLLKTSTPYMNEIENQKLYKMPPEKCIEFIDEIFDSSNIRFYDSIDEFLSYSYSKGQNKCFGPSIFIVFDIGGRLGQLSKLIQILDSGENNQFKIFSIGIQNQFNFDTFYSTNKNYKGTEKYRDESSEFNEGTFQEICLSKDLKMQIFAPKELSNKIPNLGNPILFFESYETIDITVPNENPKNKQIFYECTDFVLKRAVYNSTYEEIEFNMEDVENIEFLSLIIKISKSFSFPNFQNSIYSKGILFSELGYQVTQVIIKENSIFIFLKAVNSLIIKVIIGEIIIYTEKSESTPNSKLLNIIKGIMESI